MRAWVVHYKNKFIGGLVNATENAIDVFTRHGDHAVALRKGGDGGWHDNSKAEGCTSFHCLSPLPKEARVLKICPKSGQVIEDNLAAERKTKRDALAEADGRVPSIEELKDKGFKFDKEGNMLSAPAAPAASTAAPQAQA